MHCPQCGFENIEGIHFCGKCGEKLGIVCPDCRFYNPFEFKFCGNCGLKIKAGDELKKDPKSTKSQRKHVTVFFTDLSGYTAMTERLDPEEVRTILNQIFKKISAIIEKFDGFIERYIGDSVMAVFGIPKAHEDDPVRAISAAMEIHHAIKSMNPWIHDKTGHRILMHTGINTGLVVTGEVNLTNGTHGLTGLNINIASRLESLSQDDEILVGPKTYKLTNQFFNFQPLKPVPVKGKKGSLPVYKILSKKEKNLEFHKKTETSFLGRDKELSILNALSDQIVRQGIGNIVSIVGDPGIGKSRLVEEYKKQLTRADILWIESRSSYYLQKTSYGTFLEILKNYADIKDSDDDIKGWNKLEEKLTLLFPDEVSDTLPYLATLMSLKINGNLSSKIRFIDGDALKTQIYRAFYLFLMRLAQEQPLVLEFEDFHWADQSSVNLLDHLIPLVRQSPLLIMLISRNTKSSPASKLKTGIQKEHHDYFTEILLSPLSKEDILDLACKNMNLDPMSSELRGLIHRKCEGNPLYLEELVRTLNVNDFIIKNEATGQYTIRPLAGKVSIPDTLRGIVESSIDRLDEEMKDLLKIASVIGRNFLYCILEAIEESRHHLDTNLSILVAENMIKEKSENPVREYFFYHDLIRDAAYETILLKHRGNLHLKVGEAIENIFYDQIERFYGLLSYHFAKGSQWNKAQEYLIKAGDQANRIAGDSEALSHYKKAMSVHEKIVGNKFDDFEKAVYHRRLGEIYFRRGEHDKALVSLKQAFKLLGVSYPFGKWETRIAILNQFAKQAIKRTFFIFNKKFTDAKLKPIDQEIIKIFETMAWIDVYINQERLAFDVVSALNHAEQISSLSAAVQGYSGVGFLFDTMGFPFIARKYHDLAMRLIKTVEEDLITATAYHCLGFHWVFQGKWEDALASYKKSADQFQNIGHLKKWGNAKMMMSVVLANQGRFAQSLEICMEIAQLGLESGDHQLRGHALHGTGFNQISKGPLDQAVINLQEAIKLLKSIPDYYALAASYTDLARCYLYDEDFAIAYSMLKKTETMIVQKGIRGFMISLFYNALAETYLTIFEKSIEIRGKVTIGVVKKYIVKTIKQAKHFKCGQPKALRLNGSFFWLKGNPKKAHQFWKKGLDLCQELGSRNEEGLIYSDMGKRLNDVQSLQKAQEIFIETGARLDLAHVEKAIENLK